MSCAEDRESTLQSRGYNVAVVVVSLGWVSFRLLQWGGNLPHLLEERQYEVYQ